MKVAREVTLTMLVEDYDWRKAFEYAGTPVAPRSRWQETQKELDQALGETSEYEPTYADGTPNVTRVREEPESTSVAEFQATDVAEVIRYEEGENDVADWKLLGRLKDGRYFYLAAGCDYTGWDCQASGYVEVSMDLERLIRLGIPAADYEGMAKAGAP